jgi:thiol:disulfide interchange protein DsbD
MHRLSAAWLLATLAGLPAPSQDLPLGPERVTITAARFVPAEARPGQLVTLEVHGDIEPGYHVYGSRETTGVPIDLTVAPNVALAPAGKPIVPAGMPHVAFGQTSFWIQGSVVLRQPFTVQTAATGEVEVTGRLRYMACTETYCDPEAETKFSARLPIAAADATAQGPADVALPLPGVEDKSPKLTLQARMSPSPARPGERVELTLDATVAEGWHVYGSSEPASTQVTFALEDTPLLTDPGAAEVPPGEPHEVLGMVTYELRDTFSLAQRWTVAADAASGTTELTGTVRYAPCNDKGCLPDTETAFTVPLVIEAGPVRAAHAPSVEPPRQVGDGDGSMLGLLLAAIAAGLAALVMPCTYPMIPITFSFFTKQAERRGGSVLPLALTYGAGIVLIFVLIGVVVGQAVVPFATHWLTNLVIGVVFAVFALALFGVIELRPPAFLMDLGSGASARGGYLGVFLMGATLVIATFACTVPFVGFLLGVGAQSGLGRIALGMAAFGATMAVPFVALALLPGRMQALPRAGEWMHVVKVWLGFVELAAALKFLSNVDLVLQWSLLPRELFLMLWFGIFLVAGVFLLGLFRLAGETRAEIGPRRMTAALANILLALYFLFGALGNTLDDVVEPLLPNYSNRLAAVAGSNHGTSHELVADDYDAALARARAQDKLLLLNYTGVT